MCAWLLNLYKEQTPFRINPFGRSITFLFELQFPGLVIKNNYNNQQIIARFEANDFLQEFKKFIKTYIQEVIKAKEEVANFSSFRDFLKRAELLISYKAL